MTAKRKGQGAREKAKQIPGVWDEESFFIEMDQKDGPEYREIARNVYDWGLIGHLVNYTDNLLESLARPPRFERGAFGSGGQRSIQLSYGRKGKSIH
jgi:hypothetical protein